MISIIWFVLRTLATTEESPVLTLGSEVAGTTETREELIKPVVENVE